MTDAIPRNIIVFQSAKLGDRACILSEMEWAADLLRTGQRPARIYGSSGGSLTALAFALNLSAIIDPSTWGSFITCLDDIAAYLRIARSTSVHRFNWNPAYGFFNLDPLRGWLERYLCSNKFSGTLRFSDLPVDLYLCAMNEDAVLCLFGRESANLSFQYGFVQVGPPKDAVILDALIASLSTMLSTEPAVVNGAYYRDARPGIVDLGAMISDLEKYPPACIVRSHPHAKVRPWKLNTITSSFIMHSHHEQNQPYLTSYYLDLKRRHLELQSDHPSCTPMVEKGVPEVTHIQLPYVGSTEAITNMRDSVANKSKLVDKFSTLLEGQFDHFDFSQPANIIYGAGGFSGILAGMVTTRAVQARYQQNDHLIRQIYGVSAGVINGFFHAVQVAANRHPDLYTVAARSAMADLDDFIEHLSADRIFRYNRSPARLWKGLGNLNPLEQYLEEKLAAYTGTTQPGLLTFDDIQLPLTIAVARRDGFSDFLGMSQTGRRMAFSGKHLEVLNVPIIRAIIAGWSMNTYIQPTTINGQVYQDGGGT